MEYANCKRCGKVYKNENGSSVCITCKEEDNKDFLKVKEYLHENPGVGLDVLASELDIPYKHLLRYLHEGKLQGRS